MRHGGPVVSKFSSPMMTGRTAAPNPAPRTTTAPPIFTGSSSSGPTTQFRQHHEVLEPRVDGAEFRQAWLVRSRALALFENNLIDGQQYGTFLWWRREVERLGKMPVQKWLPRVDGAVRPGDSPTEAELAAATALRESAWALGQKRISLLLTALVEERSWPDIGKRLGLSHKTVKSRTIEAVRALHLWRTGRTVPGPPVERFRNQPGSW
jgi:hypothetical protein